MITPLAFGIGLLLGLLCGALFAKRMMMDTERSFEALSAKVLSSNTEQLLKLAESKLSGKKEVIDGTLKTMKDDLNKVEKLMRALEKDRDEKFGKIDNRLESAATVIKDLSTTTEGLKSALSSNSNRGQWGERMAEDVLRLSGLVEGVNYIKQTKLESSSSRPDFTFMLPQDLKVNMDVKFPFANYQHYIDATSETEKEKYKKEFLTDVKKRVKEVQTRDYINPEDSTLDYVLLFIPNEQIFAFINEHDRSLIDEAMEGKTILCSPLSLYATLAVIRQSIDNFHLEHKSKEMLKLFGTFKQQWLKFKEQMETVQSRFEHVHKGYEELTGVRERQLDRPLEKIEQLRMESGIEAGVENAFEKVATKQLHS